MGKRIRAFFALKPDEDGIDFLTNRIQLFRGRGLEHYGRFIQSEDLHLTMRFLGECEEEVLTQVRGQAAEIAQGLEPVSYEIERCIYFPRVARARVIAAEVNASEELKQLARRLEHMAVELGFKPERWSFKPHITIARLRQGLKRPNLPNRPGAIDQVARELLLLESLGTELGAEYGLIESFPLGAATDWNLDSDGT